MEKNKKDVGFGFALGVAMAVISWIVIGIAEYQQATQFEQERNQLKAEVAELRAGDRDVITIPTEAKFLLSATVDEERGVTQLDATWSCLPCHDWRPARAADFTKNESASPAETDTDQDGPIKIIWYQESGEKDGYSWTKSGPMIRMRFEAIRKLDENFKDILDRKESP